MDLVNTLDYCVGTIGNTGVPEAIGSLVHYAFIVIQVAVPVLLVLWGALDFAKGVIAQDEDKIKAGQKKFIQRLIAAAIVFLIVSITGFVINFVGGLDTENNASTIWECAKQLINGKH